MNKPVPKKSKIQIYENELTITYTNDSFFKRIFRKEDIISWLINIFIIILIIQDNGISNWLITILIIVPFLKDFFDDTRLKKITIKQNELKFKYTHQIADKITINSLESIDLLTSLTDNEVRLEFNNHVITFDEVEHLSLVLDTMVTLWDLKYYDTISINGNTQIFSYHLKKNPNFQSETFIKLTQTPSKTTFSDTLEINKWFAIENNVKITTSFSSEYIQVVNGSEINIRTQNHNKSELIVDLILPNKQTHPLLKLVRNKQKKITNYRDAELIYDTLKEIPILEQVQIRKDFN